MRKIWDYDCHDCGARFEVTVDDDEKVTCAECGSDTPTRTSGGRPLNVIVPMSRTSLKNKAGYVHTHGDRPAEKGSVAVPAKGNI